jgi:hypothetical protein
VQFLPEEKPLASNGSAIGPAQTSVSVLVAVDVKDIKVLRLLKMIKNWVQVISNDTWPEFLG